ncbi:hypoxia induced protein conserved region-domain-containing protein [Nemania sp. FL0916]|nr:hypoxia induced protein conserved region-domain-containing protein [Nemania sp. FL0916]
MADKPMPSSFDEERDHKENVWQKVARKAREEPLIILGVILTGLAFYNAAIAVRRGDRERAQRMFRARVGAQGFTILAMLGGSIYYNADRQKRKELIKLEAEQRAQEKNQKWLRELEVRDEEDKKLQVALQRKRERLDQKRASDEAKEAEKVKEAKSAESADAAVEAKADADTPAQKTAGGSAVLGAVASAGGWFGTGKKPADESKSDGDAEKSAKESKSSREAEKPTKGSKSDAEAEKPGNQKESK